MTTASSYEADVFNYWYINVLFRKLACLNTLSETGPSLQKEDSSAGLVEVLSREV
jgi:hypothetical protein